MKKHILFLLLVSGSLLAVGQVNKMDESGVPSQIRTYIKASYPAADKVEYAKEFNATGTLIVATFKNIGEDCILKFEDEKLVSEMREVDFESLVVSAKMESALEAKFGKFKVQKALVVKMDEREFYSLVVLCKCNPVALYDVKFDTSGQLTEYTELAK